MDAGQLLPRTKRYFPNRYTEVLQVVVMDIDMSSWTVDCASKLLGRYFADVQVGAQYLHQAAGEGVYCMPEVGAVAMLCLPTDTSGPFVMAYVSPGQTVNRAGVVDAREQGMTTEGYEEYAKNPPNQSIDYKYASNRPVAKPGDIVMRGRDGNFCILHRGGVLQIGSSELSQRIYVPLTNMVTDVSEHYEHHNVGGGIRWGMQPLDYESRESWWRQTFRVLADDRHCDVRVTCGTVRDRCPLPDGDDDLGQIKTELPIIYEVALIPSSDTSGFKGIDGEVVEKGYNQLKFLFKLDRKGSAYCRFEGNVMLAVKKDLFVKVKGDFTLQANSINMTTTGDATLGADGTTNVKGELVKLAGGGVGVARAMDMVMVPGPQIVAALSMLGVQMTNPGAAAAIGIQGAIMTASTKTETA